jgi:hypothetical protein
MGNQPDRRLNGDRTDPLKIERSRGRVVAETGEEREEYVIVCGLLTLRDKLSHLGTC